MPFVAFLASHEGCREWGKWGRQTCSCPVWHMHPCYENTLCYIQGTPLMQTKALSCTCVSACFLDCGLHHKLTTTTRINLHCWHLERSVDILQQREKLTYNVLSETEPRYFKWRKWTIIRALTMLYQITHFVAIIIHSAAVNSLSLLKLEASHLFLCVASSNVDSYLFLHQSDYFGTSCLEYLD